jgi:L-seryl-tRNA(Ser) seleniumtransferase
VDSQADEAGEIGVGPDRGALRDLPAIERLAGEVDGPPLLAVAAARAEVAALRERIVAGTVRSVDHEALRSAVERRVADLAAASLRPVLNATGVILHTNLGRAPLAPDAAAAAAVVASSYSNLEYDLGDGGRGSRHDHLRALLADLTGAEEAIAVNNNAAGVMLALAALAGDGEVIVGRDQLVEIGGSFRVPEIVAASGVRLVEVGTTNRTRAGDYEAAIGPATRALLRVHQSNFRTVGFTESPGIAELTDLAAGHGLPVIDDLGSGAADPIGDEPLVGRSVDAGAVTCFTADKLLGGPQAGVVAGPAGAVERCRRHPLARALRIDKLQLAALEATLRLRRDRGPAAIPATAMLEADTADLRRRATAMVAAIGAAATVAERTARMGGGTLPTLELPGPVCLVTPGNAGANGLAEALRRGEPPVIARIEDEAVLLDPRTLTDEEALVAAAVEERALG